MRQLIKRGVNFRTGIRGFEDRFMSEADKEFLIMIVDSMHRGQKVQIKTVKTNISATQENSNG